MESVSSHKIDTSPFQAIREVGQDVSQNLFESSYAVMIYAIPIVGICYKAVYWVGRFWTGAAGLTMRSIVEATKDLSQDRHFRFSMEGFNVTSDLPERSAVQEKARVITRKSQADDLLFVIGTTISLVAFGVLDAYSFLLAPVTLTATVMALFAEVDFQRFLQASEKPGYSGWKDLVHFKFPVKYNVEINFFGWKYKD